MKAYERLLSYVKIFTPSNEESTSSPSSRCQFDLARLLVEELKGLGISDVSLDEHCYVYAHLPATKGLEHCKTLGFIAHMDTVSDFCDHAVTPVITENYDGKDLPLGTSGRTLSPEIFPTRPALRRSLQRWSISLRKKYLTDLSVLRLLQMKRSAWDRLTSM